MKNGTESRSRLPILAMMLVVLAASTALAQEEQAPPKALELTQVLSDSLPPETTHSYTIEAPAEQFVYGVVDQISVDVVVTVQGPDGKSIGNFDIPARGPEPFYFDTEEPGVYRIDVKPFKAETGRYSIELKRLEPKATDPGKRVDQLVTPHIGEKTPGAVVAVMEGGNVTFSRAYGMASLTYSIPYTTATLNNIGSTSKQFTAFGMELLAKQGKLSLDDDVRDYIPELPDFGKKVSIRNLLTHTSGYREFLNLLTMAGRRIDEGDYIDRDEIIEILKRQPALQNDPGAEWNYNNTGFALAATIIERVTEQPFPEWMKENVFRPLGMTETVVRAHPRQIVPNRAQGYVVAEEGGYREGRDIAAAMGAGGIYTPIGDLAKWIRNFKTGEVGGKEVIREMTTRFVLTNGDTTGYGLGLFIGKERGLRKISHGGADIAHRSMLAYYPDIDAAVITQSNNASFPGSIASGVAVAFFGEHMEPEDIEETAVADSTPFNPEDYDPKKFDELVGRYELEEMPGFILTCSRSGDTLYTQATRQPQVRIVPTSDSTFKLTVVDASLTFHRNREGKVETLTLHQNGHHLAKRLHDEPWRPSAEDFEAYTGRYFSDELETFYTVAVEDSSLIVKHHRMDDINLTPSKKDTFSAGFPITELIFIRNEAGDVTGLEVSNGRTRGVKFDRW